MQVRHLKIERFRGIESLDWTVPNGLIALVGAGDTCKTTILEAVELVLSPRWNPTVTDNDFFEATTDQPVIIEATVGALPPALLTDRKFGLDLRGIACDGTLHDEPEPDDDLVVTIRFTLDADLEPTWAVVNDRQQESKPITARDREMLGVARLGGEPDRHFSWGRGSALTAATSLAEEVNRILAEAQRLMRQAVVAVPMDDLDRAVATAALAATQMGAGTVADLLVAALSADAIAARGSGLALHADAIPLDRSGLGTRRLVALGLQRLAVPSGAVQLVDEVEAGLEPFRTRHLLRMLRAFVETLDQQPGTQGQVILTTHSSVALEELDAANLHVVQRRSSGIAVRQVPVELQAVLRAIPESFLGRRVVVCEGKTELGLLRGLEAAWQGRHNARPVAHVGAVLALGQGQETGGRVMAFATLGFPVAVFADSDRPLSPTASDLTAAGVRVVTWSDGTATEGRLCTDLPWTCVRELLDLAIATRSAESVRDAVFDRLGQAPPASLVPDEWLGGSIEEEELRTAVAEAASKNSWFKRVDIGEAVGEIVARAWDALDGTDLRTKLEAVEAWVYEDDWT
ncbi:MAG: ATP-dependent nuclease [Acidimicrobiales bacterium]